MLDAPYDPETESTYECLECGRTVVARGHPGACPDCGATLRNRSTPIE